MKTLENFQPWIEASAAEDECRQAIAKVADEIENIRTQGAAPAIGGLRCR